MLLLNQSKFVFNKIYFHYIKIFITILYFHSIKTNFYSIKYILIISLILFLFNQKKLYLMKNIFIIYSFFFIQVEYFSYYMNFSFNTFLVSTSGLPFVFTKDKILISKCKLTSCMRVQKSC